MKTKLLSLLIIMCTQLLISQNTAIPDPNFEQRLIDFGYDSGSVDGVIPTANINSITTLFVPNSNISDLTGIEDFTALESLDCIGNPISSLDLSNNSALISFFTGQNQITNLNISNNIALETLVCSGTLLGNLDVSNNINLTFLACPNSQLTNLDLSNNLALTNLIAGDNLFSNLDLSHNSALETLVCTGVAGVSPLTTINVNSGNNSILTNVNIRFNNNLLCVQVDDAVAANSGTGVYDSWQSDVANVYSENCLGCPEIDVQGNSLSIVSGDSTPDINDNTDFGIVNFGSFEEQTFTIVNSQNIDLNLTGSPLIAITNSTDFTVTSQPSNVIAANGGTTSFTIRYEPSMVGTINTATLTIQNDDCDENPYTFDVLGESQESLQLTEYSSLENAIAIIPNPNNGMFKLKYEGVDPIEEVNLYNVIGKRLNKNDVLLFGHTFNFKSLSGIYFIEVKTKLSRAIKKIIIK